MNENKLPEWAITGLAEAGVDAAGWRESHRFDYGVVADGIKVQIWVQPSGKIIAEFNPLPIPEAFRLADRLARALEGKPDARVEELERRVAIERDKQTLRVAFRDGRIAELEESLSECIPLLEIAFMTGFSTGNVDTEIADKLARAKAAMSHPESEGGEG